MMKYMLILLCCCIMQINAAASSAAKSSESENAGVIQKCCTFTQVAEAEGKVQLSTVTRFPVKRMEVKKTLFKKRRSMTKHAAFLAVWLQARERGSGKLLDINAHYVLQAKVISRIQGMLTPDQFKSGIEVERLDSLLAQRPLLDTCDKRLLKSSVALLIGGRCTYYEEGCSYTDSGKETVVSLIGSTCVYEKHCVYPDSGKGTVDRPQTTTFTNGMPQSEFGSSSDEKWYRHWVSADQGE